MADHLILSLQPPRFFIFSSFPQRLWGTSKRFSGGVSFSVPDFRLASQLQSANSTSISESSSSSASPKFDLVSSTQLKDGSHFFRFGDASEIERNLETGEEVSCVDAEEHQSKIVEEASEVSTKQGVKDDNSLGSNKNSDTKIGSVISNKKTLSMNEDRATTPAKLSNVIKIKDRKRARSPAKKKREASTSVNVWENEDNGEAKLVSVSNLSSIVSVPETIQTSSTKEKVFLSGEPEAINENGIRDESYHSALQTNDPLSSNVTEKKLVIEIGNCEPNNYEQINETRLEVEARSRSSSPRPGSQSCDCDEVEQKTATVMVIDESPVVCDQTLDVKDTPMEFIEAEENLFVELTSPAAISSDGLISTSEETHPSIDEKPTSDTSEMETKPEERGNAASTMEDEETVSDTKTADGNTSEIVNDTNHEDLQLSATETASHEFTEAGSGREELVSREYCLDSGFASLQNPLKALAGREDAYFISHNNWLGIADGVSQWSLEGIHAGKYAQELMNNCQNIVSDEAAKVTGPVEVLQRSVSETKSPGSSTALIAHFDNNELHIANIGDSGFMVIRNGSILHKSSPMVLYFYFPLQITQGDDAVKLAEIYNVNLDEGDVAIIATDGLFDNLYEKEIASIVCRALEQSLEPQKIAELVAAKAQEMGRCKTARTPFADAAKGEGFDGYIGGRLDAVTVIVSLVKTLSV